MFSFNLKYFILALLFFIIEVLIALFVKDNFVRPYVGDFLVVILIYCAIRAVIRSSAVKVAAGVLLFACGVELSQYLNLIAVLGLQDSSLARAILGNSFEWIDMLAYILGILTVLFFEKVNEARRGKAYA